jgi:hypothetical protein
MAEQGGAKSLALGAVRIGEADGPTDLGTQGAREQFGVGIPIVGAAADHVCTTKHTLKQGELTLLRH